MRFVYAERQDFIKIASGWGGVKILLAVMIVLVMGMPSFPQKKGYILEGRIYNSSTKKALDFATVNVLEAGKRTKTDASGYYRINIPEAGDYTVIIQSEDMKTLKTTLVVNKNLNRDFSLNPVLSRKGEVTVIGNRDLQKVSRITMDKKEIKEVPASFNDSVSALTSLPGIMRMGGDLFGPLVIRGGDFLGVYYSIDEIPVYSPLHFGGLHSIVNSNLISEVDVYSSAFPAQFGSATSAVVNINTTDNVKEFSGYTDISLLSASLLMQTPILKDGNGSVVFDVPSKREIGKYTNAGYVIFSGRRAYWDVFLVPMMKSFGQRVDAVPNYYDYQLKAKYAFNSHHSLTLLLFGAKDYLTFIDRNYEEEWRNGVDPLMLGVRLNYNKQCNSQGLSYTYQPSESFYNKITAFSSVTRSVQSLDAPMATNLALQGLSVDSRPDIFGAKERFRWEITKNHFEIRGGAEGTAYMYKVKGKSLALMTSQGNKGLTIDINDPKLMQSFYLNSKIINYTTGGYLETKISYAGFTLVPGCRTDYLNRSGEATWDPRGMISYEFPTKTTISLAGGKYSNLFQTNPFLFDLYPNVCKIGKKLKSEKAIHRVAGIEQNYKNFTAKVEGFYNNFYDMPELYYHYEFDGKPLEGLNTGKLKSYGFEFMMKIDKKEDENGFFGWASYTYNQSKFKSGLPPFKPISIYDIIYQQNNPGYVYDPINKTANPYENQIGDVWGRAWHNYDFSMNHCFKLIAGYQIEAHTITAKFMLYTPQPYTPIVFYSPVDWWNQYSSGNYPRFTPVYGKPNSKQLPLYNRLDLRYSRKTNYSWGYLTWYIEIINALNYRRYYQNWKTYAPYVPGHNPSIKRSRNTLAIFPNFGVEVKF